MQERAVKRYIRATNESYDLAVALQDNGALDRRYGSMPENFRLGFHTDLQARGDMNRWFNGLGIDPTTDPNIWVNARVYDAGDERNYRIPDLQVGDYTIEGTLWKKDLLTPQISDIVSWSNPRTVVIVNPYEHNHGRVTRYQP